MSSKTIRAKLAAEHIAEAEALAKAGMPKSELLIYADDAIPGLQIRIQAKKAFWCLKYQSWTKTIGYIYPPDRRLLTSVSAARKLAPACKEVLDDDPALFESFLDKRYGIAGDEKKAKQEMRAEVTTWSLRQCSEFMFEQRQLADTADPIRSSYISEIRLTLSRPELKDIIDKPAALLTDGIIDRLKIQIGQAHGASATRKFIGNIRTILTYCALHASGDSGLSKTEMWWKNLTTGKKKAKARTRTPTIDDIVGTLILATKYSMQPLPWRTDSKRAVRPNVLAALWWLVLTAQRAFSGLHLKRDDFFLDPERPHSGWHLACWSADMMKANRGFILPIPPQAAELMKKLMEKAKDEHGSAWAFPSERCKPGKDICIDRNSPGALIERLAGRDNHSRTKHKGKVEPYDLLAESGIEYWSPHDIRRTLGDLMSKHGIPGGASAVLAHQIDLARDLQISEKMTVQERRDTQALRVSRITREAYGADGFIPLQSRAMELWVSTIIGRYRELTGEIRTQTDAAIIDYIEHDIADLDKRLTAIRAAVEQEIEQLSQSIPVDKKMLEADKKRLVSAEKLDELEVWGVRHLAQKIAGQEQRLQHLIDNSVDEIAERLQLVMPLSDDFEENTRSIISERDQIPEYHEIKRQLVCGDIGFDELLDAVRHLYGIEVAGKETDEQERLRALLAEV